MLANMRIASFILSIPFSCLSFVSCEPQLIYNPYNIQSFLFSILGYNPFQSNLRNQYQNFHPQQQISSTFENNLLPKPSVYRGTLPTRIDAMNQHAFQTLYHIQTAPLHKVFPFLGSTIHQPQGGIPPESTRFDSRPYKCNFYHEVGDCVRPSECISRGGKHKGPCGETTACCIFVLNCGNSTNAYSSYFRNSKWPISDTLSSSCQVRIDKADGSTCGLRVLLRTFSLPASTGYCDGIALSAFGIPGKNYEPLCGSLDRYEYDIPFGSSSNSVYLDMTGKDWLKSRWEIHITQLSCSEFQSPNWPEVHSGSDKIQPQGPPQPEKSPALATQILPSVASSTPVASSGTTNSGELASTRVECGLLGTRSEKHEFPFRNYGQLPIKKQRCLDSNGGDLCPHHELNTFTRDLEWGTPVLNESILYKYAGEPSAISSRITFGRPTEPHEFPWVVAMYTGRKFHCGASLISDRHVLTAAHCVVRQRSAAMRLSIGDWDINSQVDGQNFDSRVSKIVTHPGYSTVTLKYDVAVLTLAEKVKITDFVRHICLPAFDIPLDDNLATVTGWGRNEHKKLQSVMMKHTAYIVPNPECNDRWAEKGSPKGIIADSMICMDPQDGDSCKGDSGGPATMEYPHGSGRYVQVGIVSFGSASCTDKRLPGVYTNVGKVVDWIRKQME